MSRLLLISLLNIALPFILRAIYIYSLRVIARRKQKQGMKDVTPPSWHFPIFKLLIIGLLLLTASLGIYRIFGTELDKAFVGNAAKSERY